MSHTVLDNLKRVTRANKFFREINRVIDSPFKNQLHVRFLYKYAHRAEIRAAKSVQTINLRLLLNRGRAYWNEQPSCFENLFRHKNRWSENLAHAKTQHRHFQELGLSGMTSKVKQSVDQIESRHRHNTYFGFNKISLTQALVILAKASGFEFLDGEFINSVTMSPDLLHECLPAVRERLFLSPRLYTLGKLWLETLPKVQGVHLALESAPEVGYKPLFDHFYVLIPSVEYPTSDFRGFVLDEKIRAERGRNVLDVQLVKNGILKAALLGEVDKNLYFICFWE